MITPSLRKFLLGFSALLVIAVCGQGLVKSQTDPRGPSRDAASSRDLRSGFGKPETISGKILSVDPRGILILKREGPSEPASTQLTVTETHSPNQTGSSQPEEVQAAPGPGQTDYTFRITTSTQIRANGQRQSLADLAGLSGQHASVRFIPRRSGNFASTVEVGQ